MLADSGLNTARRIIDINVIATHCNIKVKKFFSIDSSYSAKVKRSANVFISNVHEFQTFDYASDDADLNIRIKADFNVLICFIR